ncbi:MAG: ABC transporter permease [Anaerolineae bacterium]|nr:ABC transporter permease [Anaerolineae bacterium]
MTNNPLETSSTPPLAKRTVEFRKGEVISSIFSQFGILFIVILLAIVFGATAPRFLLVQNIVNIFKQVSVVAIMAIGMTMVILIGGIDLSVGSVALLAGATTMYFINHEVTNTPIAILLGLLASALVGLLNGVLVEKAKISPIIVTLGTMIAIRGLAQSILWLDNSWAWVKAPLFKFVANESILFFPLVVIVMLVMYLIFWFILSQTSFGRYLYAIGGNQKATYLCGIPVERVKIFAYTLCGFTAGVGGLVLISRLSAVSPAVGLRIEFDVITAVILGGASLSGGSGRLEKTLLGAIIVGMILNYLTIKGIPGTLQSAVNGFIILIAAVLDRLSKVRSAG